MLQYRTDLAMEAHELLCARSRAQTLSGVDSRTVFRRGCSVTSVRIDTEGAARQLGKPRGRYVTLDGDTTIYRMEETALAQVLTLAALGLS